MAVNDIFPKKPEGSRMSDRDWETDCMMVWCCNSLNSWEGYLQHMLGDPRRDLSFDNKLALQEYEKLVEEVKKDRYKANCNVASIAGRIYDLMPRDGDFKNETMGRVKNLYAMLGEAIEQARTASDIYDYYITDDACTNSVLDRLMVKRYEIGDEDNYQKEEES